MSEIIDFIKENKNGFLLLEGKIPTLTLGLIKEEFILYNIDTNSYNVIIDDFNHITGKSITASSLISKLSHGQKLILSALIALNSSALKIKFHNFFISLSDNNRSVINGMINQKRLEGKIIEVDDDHGSFKS